MEHAFDKKILQILQGKSPEDRFYTQIKIARTSIHKRATGICDIADKARKRANALV